MTKERLYYESDADYKAMLDIFFESNVCVPKGINRHKYADVLHEWVEGSSMEIRYSIKDAAIQNQVHTKWISFNLSENDEYRIKPSEPVCEWKWAFNVFWFGEEVMTDYRSDDEMKGKPFTKIEETKRERKL